MTQAHKRLERQNISYEPVEVPLPARNSALSGRENEIARLAARGYSNKEIGRILEISPWTVASHLKSIFFKLGISRRGQISGRLRGEPPVILR